MTRGMKRWPPIAAAADDAVAAAVAEGTRHCRDPEIGWGPARTDGWRNPRCGDRCYRRTRRAKGDDVERRFAAD